MADNRLSSLKNAIKFLDMVRDTPAHERPEGVLKDALHGLEEAAREVIDVKPDQNFAMLSSRVRPNVEVAPWVYEEIVKIEQELYRVYFK
jgi:hypothetical protein